MKTMSIIFWESDKLTFLALRRSSSFFSARLLNPLLTKKRVAILKRRKMLLAFLYMKTTTYPLVRSYQFLDWSVTVGTYEKNVICSVYERKWTRRPISFELISSVRRLVWEITARRTARPPGKSHVVHANTPNKEHVKATTYQHPQYSYEKRPDMIEKNCAQELLQATTSTKKSICQQTSTACQA